MLTIREEQLAALSANVQARFEARAERYLCSNLPERCQALGQRGVRQLIRQAIAKGARYGIRQERQVLGILNIMCALGNDFDTDPRFSWASDVLGDSRLKSAAKMTLLDYHVRQALRRAET